MANLKKVIPLSEASKISGYHSDYLSALIRKQEMKGEKIGGAWFTTEEEVKNYIFKQKIQHKKWALKDFFSQKRTQNIFAFSGIIFLSLLLVFIYVYGKNTKVVFQEVQKTLSSDAEVIK